MISNKTKPTRRASHERPFLQWGAALLGAVMTSTVVAVVIWEMLLPASPPDLTAKVVHQDARSGGFVVEVEVHNRGRGAATDVQVEGLSEAARSSATIDYVPGQGRGRTHLRFDQDTGLVRVTVTGWSEP